jgi:hypothetical protein
MKQKPSAHGSPGSHPHSDRPNWQPATTIDDYARNCAEGLEKYSERRMVKLMGVSRAGAWRMQLAACVPEDLVDKLYAAARERKKAVSLKQLAEIGRALMSGGPPHPEEERCPHCGGLVRLRERIPPYLCLVVGGWLEERRNSSSGNTDTEVPA